jgi:hypothetical protein
MEESLMSSIKGIEPDFITNSNFSKLHARYFTNYLKSPISSKING